MSAEKEREGGIRADMDDLAHLLDALTEDGSGASGRLPVQSLERIYLEAVDRLEVMSETTPTIPETIFQRFSSVLNASGSDRQKLRDLWAIVTEAMQSGGMPAYRSHAIDDHIRCHYARHSDRDLHDVVLGVASALGEVSDRKNVKRVVKAVEILIKASFDLAGRGYEHAEAIYEEITGAFRQIPYPDFPDQALRALRHRLKEPINNDAQRLACLACLLLEIGKAAQLGGMIEERSNAIADRIFSQLQAGDQSARQSVIDQVAIAIDG